MTVFISWTEKEILYGHAVGYSENVTYTITMLAIILWDTARK